MVGVIVQIALLVLAAIIVTVIMLLKEKEKKQQAVEFRRIYGFPDDAAVYQSAGVNSLSPMSPTKHEQFLAKYIVNQGFFNRYYVFLDYYFRDREGIIRQIDLIAVGSHGICVFESKDYNGWIFGNGNHFKWTQTLGGEKYHFYNPVKQNNTHIRSLKECLGLNTKFHSIVVFGSRATLKVINNIPHNTYVVSGNNLGNALNSIANTQDEFLRENEVIEICKKINSKRLLYDESLKSEHIESIHGLTGGR